MNHAAPKRNRQVMADARSDDELVASMGGGDDLAPRELFSRHAPSLASRLRVVLPSADVEDVLQETFVAAWRGARRYRTEGRAGGWLWGIARRQAALLLRRRGQAGLSLPDPDALIWKDAVDLASATAWNVDLQVAIAALGPPGSPEREVWELLYLDERSVAEIAELVGVPEGTVKSRSHRARRMLRALLGRHLAIQGGSL
jgi:RNA polymerase sigma-70 factor (ECF subfamily)